MSYTVQVARVNVIGSNLVSYVVYAVGRATVKKYEASVCLKDSPLSERKLTVFFSENCLQTPLCLPSIERNSLSLKFIEKFVSITLVKPV